MPFNFLCSIFFQITITFLVCFLINFKSVLSILKILTRGQKPRILAGICTLIKSGVMHKILSKYNAILRVVSATFLLLGFLSLNERICQTRENVFYFTSKALFVLEKIKFLSFLFLNT